MGVPGDVPAPDAVAPGAYPGPSAALAGAGGDLLGGDAGSGHAGRGAPFPGRSEIIFLAFCVTVATLLLHGLTLPWVIRRLGVEGRESFQDALAEADAVHAATQAALERLETVSDGAPDSVTARLRRLAEHRSHSVWERLGRPETELGEAPSAIYRRLRLEMLAAERQTLVGLRDAGRINDEVLSRTLRDLDLEEAMLSR